MSDETKSILMNTEVIAIDQDPEAQAREENLRARSAGDRGASAEG